MNFKREREKNEFQARRKITISEKMFSPCRTINCYNTYPCVHYGIIKSDQLTYHSLQNNAEINTKIKTEREL